jgi:hypothetical protein
VVVQSIDNAGFFSVGIILVLLMDRLHEFVQLADLLICIQSACVKCDSLKCLHTTHFINLALIHLLAFPRITLEGLGIQLPF